MRKVVVVILWLFVSLTIKAQTGAFVYDFLNLPVSSYAAGLGGTILSSPENDLNLALHNPAALSTDMHNMLSMGYMNYIADIHMGQAAYSRKINEHSSWLASIRYLDYGRIDGADEYNQTTWSTHAKDMAIGGGYAFLLSDYWRGGANMHFIYSVLDEYTSLGMVVDLGVYYKNPDKQFQAGLVVKNLGSQFTPYEDTYEPLPWDIQLGISKTLEHAPFRVSLTAWGFNSWAYPYTSETTEDVIDESTFVQNVFKHLLIGVELVPSDNFQLSIGYNARRRLELAIDQRTLLTGFSAGFSTKVKKLRVGASFAKYHLAGNSLQMTLSFQPGKL